MIISDKANNEQPPVGVHSAICVSLVDIGTQRREYKGTVKMMRRVRIGWQLPECKRELGDHAGEPFLVTEFYTASLSEKAALRHLLVNWRGREFNSQELASFNLSAILGKPCLISLNEREDGRVGCGAVMNLPKGMNAPQLNGGTQYFSLEPEQYNESVFQNLPDGIKAMIETSREYQFIKNGDVVQDLAPDDNDVPDVIHKTAF